MHDHISTEFGIVRNSILNELDYFHVVSGLVPDIIHNILEGICCWHLVYVLDDGFVCFFIIIGTLELCIRLLIIQYILIEKRFTLQKLNSRIDSFFYGPDIANKPSPISAMHLTNGHLKQSDMFANCS